MDKVKKPIKGWIRVLLIIIPFLLFVGISQMLAAFVLGLKLRGQHETLTTFQTLVFELFMLAGTFAVVALFRRWIDRESFRSLGFGMKNFRKEAESGFWLGLFMIATGFLLLVLLQEITWVGVNPNVMSIFLSFGLFIAVAFTEELFFRGYILNNLMLSMNRWVALLVSSIVFSLAHMGNAHITVLSFTSIILAGILLGLPFIFTRSLWLPVSLHFSWNFFQGTIFGFSVSGNTEYALVTQTRTADTLWNGGPFGFEGSLLAVIFLSVAIVALAIYYRRKEKMVPLTSPTVIPVIEVLPQIPAES
jgi:membrane protease YdiL (CAAX protease family)